MGTTSGCASPNSAEKINAAERAEVAFEGRESSLTACVLRTVEIREDSTPARRSFAAGAQWAEEVRCLALRSVKSSGDPATVPGREPAISAERHQARDWRAQ